MAKTSMILKQQKEQKYSTRKYNRCKICGRPHAYLRKYGICRICGGIHVYRILRKHHLFSDGYGDGVKLSPLHTPKWEKSHVGQYTFRASRKAMRIV